MDAELHSLIARNTDAVIRQSTTNEQLAGVMERLDARLVVEQSTTHDQLVGVMERLEARLAVQPPASITDPRIAVAKLIVISAVSALVASCTVLAWRLL